MILAHWPAVTGIGLLGKKVQAVFRAMRLVRIDAGWNIWTLAFFALGCSAQTWAADSSSRKRR